MKLSLYQRLAIAICISFTLIAFVLAWWVIKLDTLSRLQAEQSLHLNLAEHLVQDNPLLSQGVTDYAALENLFHTSMILGPSFEFYFVSPKGKLLTYSAAPGKVKREQIDLSPVKALIKDSTQLPVYGDDPRGIEQSKIFSAAPVFNKDKLQGYLYIIIGGEDYDSAISRFAKDSALKQILSIVFIALIVLLIGILFLFRILTLPLKRLNQDMKAFKQAGFDRDKVTLSHWQDKPEHEIHQLGKNFIQLADQINFQLVKLKENDRYRRELLAQLSHDLRTPLSSIQGYIETIYLKKDQLTEKEKAVYIKTALKSTLQLRGLIEQVFELAHLESGQVSVELESFPLGELLYDIAAKFSLKMKAKNIKMIIEPKQCHYQVYTDMGKLERILTNLLENALRHSFDGGVIKISVKERSSESSLCICVIDNGTGIAKQDIPYIFETRYRGTNAIGEKHKHGGMGLAITRKLLKLLHSDIAVRSQEGKGTAFIFDLKSTG